MKIAKGHAVAGNVCPSAEDSYVQRVKRVHSQTL